MVLGEKEQALGVGEAHVSALGRPQPAPPMMMPAGREAASHVRGASKLHTLRPPSERVTVHALFSPAFVYGPSWKTEPDPSVYTRLAGEGGGRRRGLGGGGALGAKGPGAGSHRPWSQPSLGTGPERLRCLRFMEVHKYGSARFVQDPTSLEAKSPGRS